MAEINVNVGGNTVQVNVEVKPASLPGPKGDPFEYEDFTPEQLEGLRGPQGIQGEKGDKGDTGERGPQGVQGIQGERGPQGADGKSAYQIALDNGFEGTEAEWLESLEASSKDLFLIKLRNENDVLVHDYTLTEVQDAAAAGRLLILLTPTGAVCEYNGISRLATGLARPHFVSVNNYASDGLSRDVYTIDDDYHALLSSAAPLRTPNPKAITFTGAVEAEYDGTSAVTVEIPTGGLPEGGEAHQQLVTDGEGDTQWENRTHWAESVEGYLLSECEAVMNDVGDEGMITQEFTSQPIAGETYTVTWNGVDYECVAESYTINDDGVPLAVVLLGNPELIGGTANDMPFVIIIYSAETAAEFGITAALAPLDGSTAVTLSIRGIIDQVHPLDEKYIPDTIARAADIPEAGLDGKSAYEYAQEGGYTGTEAEFSAKLAQNIPKTLPNPYSLLIFDGSTGDELTRYDGTATRFFSLPNEAQVAKNAAYEALQLARSGLLSYEVLADKPVGQVGKDGELIPETVLEMEEEMTVFDTIYNFEAGAVYVVTWNGMDYECTAQKFKMDFGGNSLSGVYIGNGLMIGMNTNTDLPFGIGTFSTGDETFTACADVNWSAATQVTVRVTGVLTVKQLDEMYIPDTIARKNELMQVPADITSGQVMAVDTVDESGNVTAWKAATLFQPPGSAQIDQVLAVKSIDTWGVPKEWKYVTMSSSSGSTGDSGTFVKKGVTNTTSEGISAFSFSSLNAKSVRLEIEVPQAAFDGDMTIQIKGSDSQTMATFPLNGMFSTTGTRYAAIFIDTRYGSADIEVVTPCDSKSALSPKYALPVHLTSAPPVASITGLTPHGSYLPVGTACTLWAVTNS